MSLTKRIGTISLLLILAFIIVGAIGYFPILLKDNDNTGQTTNLATGAKIGFLYSLLPVTIGYTLSRSRRFLKNFFGLKLPYFLGWAVMIGLTLAIIDGNSVLLGIGTGQFWSKVSSGFLQGSIAGAIAEILIQKTENKEEADNSTL